MSKGGREREGRFRRKRNGKGRKVREEGWFRRRRNGEGGKKGNSGSPLTLLSAGELCKGGDSEGHR